MSDLEVVFEPEQSIVDHIDSGLEKFNLMKLGGWECDHLAVVAKDEQQKMIGGLYGTL